MKLLKVTKAYTLKEHKESGELHLFEGRMKEKGCTSDQDSICTKMDKDDSSGNVFACKDENEARIRCAQIGRRVCGVCVSRLYTTYGT